MAQHDYVIANGTGAAVRSDLNNALAAIVTQNSGATAPATTYAYQWWADTTTGLLKLRNAANNAWITLFQLDGEWSTLAVENGSAAAPSIYFKDSGTDTGIYSPGTDQVAISTNGTQRLAVDTAATTSTLPVVHPLGAVGTPSITFTGDLNTGIWSPAADTIAFSEGGVEVMRIDSSGRVGIGTTAPQNSLSVGSSSGTQIGLSLDWTGAGGPYQVAGLTADRSSGEIRQYAFTNFFPTFYANNSERARIDTSGRLLVGTSTARTNFFNSTVSAALQVEGTGNDSSSLSIIRNSNDVGRAILTLAKTRGSSVGSTTIVQNNDLIGSVEFQGSDGTEFVQAAAIECQVDGTPGANDMPGRLVFSTTADGASSPTERMRIGQNGLFYFFSSGSTTLYTVSSSAAGTTNSIIQGGHSATSTTTGSTSFVVYTNGNVVNTNNSYGAISDVKLKENIVDANSQWDDLKALQVRNYNFKEGQTHTQIGLVAQEAELVSPGLVTESPDRDAEGNDLGTVTKSVNYSVLYMKAVKALQEAMERIETLEAKVAALESA